MFDSARGMYGNFSDMFFRPRDIARRGEADIVKFIVRKELGLSIVEILDPDAVIGSYTNLPLGLLRTDGYNHE